MTKEQHIELFQRQQSGGTMPADLKDKLHPQVIAKFMAMAWNTLLYQVFRKEPSNLDFYAKTYYDIAINHDPVHNIYYSILPSGVIQVPDEPNEGVRRIDYALSNEFKFAPIKKNAGYAYRELEVYKYTDTIPFFVQQNKVIYDLAPYDIQAVNMDLIVPFDKMANKDEVNIPSGQDVIFYQMVAALMENKSVEDRYNDNNPKQV